jgi:hypothetical protein
MAETAKNILIVAVIGGGVYLFWQMGGFGLIKGVGDLVSGVTSVVKNVGGKVGGGSLLSKVNKDYVIERSVRNAQIRMVSERQFA